MELNGSHTPLSDGLSIETTSGSREISNELTIQDTTLSDALDYVCVASNVVYSAEMSATLTVYGELNNCCSFIGSFVVVYIGKFLLFGGISYYNRVKPNKIFIASIVYVHIIVL